MSRVPFTDREECTGCSLCVDSLPEAFPMNGENLAQCYNAESASEKEIQSEAMALCLIQCILWREVWGSGKACRSRNPGFPGTAAS